MFLKVRHRNSELLFGSLHKIVGCKGLQIWGWPTVEVRWDANDATQSEEVTAAVLDWCAGKKPLNFGGKLKRGLVNIGFRVAQVMCLIKDDT